MFLEAYLTRIAKQIRLEDWEKILDLRIANKESGPFELWGGHFSSLDHALAEFDLERRIYYKKALTNEKTLYDALLKDGITEEQIIDLIKDGKMVRTCPK